MRELPARASPEPIVLIGLGRNKFVAVFAQGISATLYQIVSREYTGAASIDAQVRMFHDAVSEERVIEGIKVVRSVAAGGDIGATLDAAVSYFMRANPDVISIVVAAFSDASGEPARSTGTGPLSDSGSSDGPLPVPVPVLRTGGCPEDVAAALLAALLPSCGRAAAPAAAESCTSLGYLRQRVQTMSTLSSAGGVVEQALADFKGARVASQPLLSQS